MQVDVLFFFTCYKRDVREVKGRLKVIHLKNGAKIKTRLSVSPSGINRHSECKVPMCACCVGLPKEEKEKEYLW